ncbi:serum paraoxonase/lactonase 3 [Patella vulgata]|uniref:serum paraoxonase/lactonase 3 n=1 Tax=Patella vulgata TaxID=6465 RepID=UPI00218078BA|nr:serum paraoxonase/lactonase 3 [Patella vulgata]
MLMKLIFVSLFLFLVQHIIKVVYLLGFHLHYYQHYPGECEQIKDMGLGSEDFHTFPDGLTFITSGFAIQNESVHKREYMVKHNMLGRIYLFDFNKNKAKVDELSIVGTNGGFNVKLFHPHGISGWLNKSGTKILFVVNHERLGVDYIEKFEFVPGKKQLKHIKRYRDDTMLLVNDVQATSDDSFYFTNFGTGHNPEIKLMQSLALLRWTTVVYFDGSYYRIVLDGMAMSNGIAMSNDGRYIYISNHDARELVVAKREANNDLIIKQVYPLYTFIDNIIVDMKTDHLYIGSHPIKYQLARHLDNPQVYRTPSQVLKLEMKDGNVTGTKELFYDDGDLISGSATAIVFNNKLLIGSVIDKTVICSFDIPE